MSSATGPLTKDEKLILSYVALCGVVLVYHVSGNILVAILLGIPPAVFGVGGVLLLHRHWPFRLQSPSHIAKAQRIGLASLVIGMLILLAVRAFWSGDMFTTLILLLFLPPACYWSYTNVRASP